MIAFLTLRLLQPLPKLTAGMSAFFASRVQHARALATGSRLTLLSGAVLISTSLMLPTASGQTIMRDDIAPFEVVYDVGNNLLTAGSAKLSLHQDEDGFWIYSLTTRPKGVFKLTGKGRIAEISIIELHDVDKGVTLHPQRYSYRQDEEKRRSVDAWFDWPTNELIYQRRGEEVSLEFTEPVLDRLSVTLAIMNMLRHGFDSTTLPIFDNGQIKNVEFINEGTETLDTKMGKVETIRVTNRNVKGSSRSTTTWFAPSLDYIPVRIEQMKRDELVARLSLLKLDNRVTNIELVSDMPDDGEDEPQQGKALDAEELLRPRQP